jgi:lysophospholipid acyltransferase (LPLAT)-like uncharacterized protein
MKLFFMRWLRGFFGFFAGLILLLLRATMRIRSEGNAHRRACMPGPLLFAAWHSQQLGGVLMSDVIKLSTMASRSKDGDIIAAALRVLGITAVRGSSSRGGHEALAAIEARVHRGDSVVITVDGPRGPAHDVKLGILALAQRTGRPIIPTAPLCAPVWRARSWDRYEVPLPFARGRLVFGEPMWISPSDDLVTQAKELKARLEALASAE